MLPGEAAPDGHIDPRWQAIIRISEFIHADPEAVWPFILRWGSNGCADVRAAIATCLLEHLLEEYFQQLLPRIELAVRANKDFADTFLRCAKFGQSESPENSAEFDRVQSIARQRTI